MFGLMGVARAKGQRRNAAVPFDISSIFGASDEGVAFALGSSSNLFQLSTGSTAVAAPNDPIGYAVDLSGKAHHATQATAGNRMLWRGIPRDLGAELLTNGRFTADTDWTKGTGWTISAPIATKTAGSAAVLSQSVTLTAGQTYQLSYTMTRSAGSLTPRFTGGTTASAPARSASGSYNEVIVAVSGNVTIEFSADAAFAGTVKSVTLKPVTAMSLMGGQMFGSPRRLVTPAINFTGSDKLTVIMGLNYSQETSNTTAVAVGNVATTAGTAWCGYATNPAGRIRGDSGTAVVTLGVSETPIGGGGGALDYVDCHEFDLSETTIADEVTITTCGVVRAGASSGTTAGGGTIGNVTVDLGIASFRGIINRVVVINRLLSPEEKEAAINWVRDGRVYAAVMGDSTVASLFSPLPNVFRVSSFVGGLVTGRYEISESGRRIADMLGFWNALDTVSHLQAVIIQIGLNDVKGRVGEGTATTAQVISDLQNLVDTVRADVSSSCKILICGLTPCKAWLDLASDPAAAYQAWLDVNAAIAGTHSTNIAGVDARVTSHVAELNDGAGNLLEIYNYADDDVHESAEARFIIAQAWRAGLEGLGLLQAPA